MYQFFTIGSLSPIIIKSKDKAEKVILELVKLRAIKDLAKTVDESVWLVLVTLGKNQFKTLSSSY